MPGLAPAEARARFAASRIARLATADAAGRPHLVPVVFVVDGDRVAMAVDHKPKRSPRLKRLANIRANPAVCLLADAYDEDWDRLWWVRADGSARVLPPAAETVAEPAAETVAGSAAEPAAPDAAASARWTELLAAKYPRQYTGRHPEGEVVEIAVTAWTGWRAT
ncbi:PPOX class probable F420-dependent enzyme, Rv0121 family [Actinacidiphila yanglinensis]|uniref:PPOX class probable F420-dependent enzyme, Rv0121 family n=1 Tax=Actinacidiphila yanglinensis TaxID=310779 RepID=A0A1H5SUK2_9ACTN|nr:TIGR03668 family PPOX class F420-dependent oxidoreductase [Actinacidiphila yanglinensis]SEF54215.1 PPOX class probable F420-dependent enzyme, Rv0121 family [Actinacidiphila yanglinensis]